MIARLGWLPLLAAVYLAACAPTITPDKVKKIKVCETTYAQVKEMFGQPDQVGEVGGHTTWRYDREGMGNMNLQPPRLLLMFDNDTVVSDLAYNPPGIIELKSRCSGN